LPISSTLGTGRSGPANAIASWSLAKSSPYRPNRATRSHPSRRNENARDQSPPPSSEMSRALPRYRSSRNPAACTSRTRPPATSQPQGQVLPATVTEPHWHHALSHPHEHKTLAAAAGSASPFPPRPSRPHRSEPPVSAPPAPRPPGFGVRVSFQFLAACRAHADGHQDKTEATGDCPAPGKSGIGHLSLVVIPGHLPRVGPGAPLTLSCAWSV
jgi:hypothetical protein